ncbi:MAG: HD domain-containing protein [Patescibacteria group bacterium]|nr:HD domain-containing protein [Patescibacteria group bacterium]
MKSFKKQLLCIAEKKMPKNDPSHDINHTLRVLAISEKIAVAENADFDIIVPSAIFHDVINYPKNHRKRLHSAKKSAKFAKKILNKTASFPKNKIEKVYNSINFCSFTKALKPDFLEAKILQDADGLEATGAISIMRTFSSARTLNKTFYNTSDPFCEKRKPEDNRYALDLFFTRLLVIQNRLHTKTAKMMAKKRVEFLKIFLKELEFELLENNMHFQNLKYE